MNPFDELNHQDAQPLTHSPKGVSCRERKDRLTLARPPCTRSKVPFFPAFIGSTKKRFTIVAAGHRNVKAGIQSVSSERDTDRLLSMSYGESGAPWCIEWETEVRGASRIRMRKIREKLR